MFDQPVWKWRALAALVALFTAWVGISWMYAYLALGWSWWYVPLTAAVLLLCGVLKRRRLYALLNPMAAPPRLSGARQVKH